jgi:hypothetical protein
MWTCRFNDTNFNYYSEIVFFFDSLSSYMHKIEELINHGINVSLEYYNDYARLIEEGETWQGELNIEAYDISQKEFLKGLYFNSLIIAFYSFTERKLKFLCERFDATNDIKLESISGKGIFKYRRYLEDVIKISFSEIENEWSQLIVFGKLRNNIIHESEPNSISKKNQVLINFITSLKGLEVVDLPEEIYFEIKTSELIKQLSSVTYEILEHLYYIRKAEEYY